MAFSFYIKPPLILSYYSPINSRTSQQVNGKGFLGLLPNRHKCLSHPFSRLCLRGWALLHGQTSPRRLRSSQSPQGANFHVGAEGCEPSTVAAAPLVHLWPFGIAVTQGRVLSQLIASQPKEGNHSWLLQGTATKAVSGLLFHSGICSTQHYSSSTETS